jgi:DNA polymerase-3 subunit gamma/tau
MARLVAKSLSCTGKERPCNVCDSCRSFNEGSAPDLIEIDAASNRGIDEVRELREAARSVPIQGKYKVYVIDECHQLTKEAFNALLKILEEPPSHAVFILATTELEKVPATIISRTQHYMFRRPTEHEIAARLRSIAAREQVSLDEDGARLIARAAEGALRDAESILGQIIAVEDKNITRAEVEEILGLPKREAVKQLFGFVAKKDLSSALALIGEIHTAGHDMAHAAKLLMRYFRNSFFLKTDKALARFVENDLLPDEIECLRANLDAFSREDLRRGMDVIVTDIQKLRHSPIPQLPLELTIAELIERGSGNI